MPISEAGAISSLPSQSSRSVGSSGSVAVKSVVRVMTFWLEWQRAQFSAKTHAAALDRARREELGVELDLEVARRWRGRAPARGRSAAR